MPTCANPRCSSGWLHLWRSREAPVFEGRMVLLGRMHGGAGGSGAGPGDGRRGAAPAKATAIAFRSAWPCWSRAGSTRDDLRAALAAQRAAGSGRLGNWLVRQQSVSEELVTRALGLQWGCPVLGMEFHNPKG